MAGFWERWAIRAPAPAPAALPDAEARSLENPGVPVSSAGFMRHFGLGDTALTPVTNDSALQVMPFLSGVNFLSRAMATLPLQLFQDRGEAGAEKQNDAQAIMLRDAVNPELTSFDWRQWMWLQVFTGGRALTWIERNAAGKAVALWPMDPAQCQIERVGGSLRYRFGASLTYAAADVIDVVWMPKPNLVGHYSPVSRGSRTLQLALTMDQYAAKLFANGGVPPLVIKGPIPSGAEAMKRAMTEMAAAMKWAEATGLPMGMVPPGYSVEPVGFEPGKAQMIEGKKYLVIEIARLLGLPPVFLQDLTHGTFTNTEQQDLQLVKHVIVGWAVKLEQQMNLKLFGPRNARRYVKHNVSALERGDFKTRIEALARGVQGGLLTPNEGRAFEDRGHHSNPAADELFMQGATVVLGQQAGAPPVQGGQNAD